MQNLTFEHATIHNLPEIVAIYNSTVATRLVTADTEPVTVESKMDWFNKHNTTNRPLWLVKSNHEIVGWVSFQSFYGRPAYNATAEISIYLHEQYRNKGFGKHILNYCISTAPLLGVKTLLGFIFEHNQPSLKLFSALGFEEWAFLPKIALLDDKEFGLKILGMRVA
ncbi:GNAT family N-acetyltransferase [Myroides sp. JBRI-B21084]|uniref:GNAT family N-acetyltransferase n=1 Tax=Myroides sp. JBRI-B21084 TaxID=3119977 RepID=UPI0026E3C76F|nr:GNAT family N-acetyltransferase [Paenimyroides cloacae]WKW46059.1 GNAT family N-acetyltransferase [Paenimyroides cloacae]